MVSVLGHALIVVLLLEVTAGSFYHSNSHKKQQILQPFDENYDAFRNGAYVPSPLNQYSSNEFGGYSKSVSGNVNAGDYYGQFNDGRSPEYQDSDRSASSYDATQDVGDGYRVSPPGDAPIYENVTSNQTLSQDSPQDYTAATEDVADIDNPPQDSQQESDKSTAVQQGGRNEDKGVQTSTADSLGDSGSQSELGDLNSVAFNDVKLDPGMGEPVGKVLVTGFSGNCKEKGYQFNGGYVKISTQKLKPVPKSDMTFAAWFRVRDTDRIHTLYSTGASNGARHYLEIRPSDRTMPNGKVRWIIKTAKTTILFTIETEDVVPAGIWTHIVAKYDSEQGRAYIFINGEKTLKVKEVPKDGKLEWGPEVIIGGAIQADTEKTISRYAGNILKIRIVDYPLTDAEIESLFEECTPEHGDAPYHFTVCSKETYKSATSSSVFVQLIGNNGQFGEVKIGSGFSPGCSKTITIDGPHIGDIKRMRIRKGTDGLLNKDWQLDKITVVDATLHEKASHIYTFKCDCKFADKDDTLLRTVQALAEVNGGWSKWSQWSGCGSGMCGGDKKVRTRACTNPLPSDGGLICVLSDGKPNIFDKQTEPCEVDGGWGAWGTWSDCDKICGGSVVKRTRECNNPGPANGGKPCSGANSETKQDCTEPCENWPVDGEWSAWESWSACAKTCGGSTVTRKRTCSNPAPKRGGLPCVGDAAETATDCTNHCPIDGGWTEWEQWSDCSKTCGPGKQIRERNCTKPPPAYGGKPCTGVAKETKDCKVVFCPDAVNGNWGKWGAYTACTEKEFCNQGTRARTRKCDSPAPAKGGDLCPGVGSEEDLCPKEKCKPVKGDSIQVKPKSFITETCKASTANFAGGTKAKEIPASIYSKHLASISDIIKTSYFGKITEKKDNQELTKFCFQPTVPLAIDKLKTIFAGYTAAQSLPSFTKPAGDKETAGLAVELKADGSLYSAEFSLGDAESYSPTSDVKVTNARFSFKEKPDSRGVVAYGEHNFVNAKFDVEVSLGPSVKGSSADTTDAASIIKTLSLPQVSALAGTPQATAKDQFINWLIDYLSQFALSKVPISGLTEAASGTTKRMSGSLTSDAKDLFYVEVIKQNDFAIGFTSTKTAFKNFMNKIISKAKRKKGAELFGEMRDATIGIAYAQTGFIVDAATTFEREPLKTGFATTIKEGLFIAARMRLPETCTSNVCKIAQFVFGKDTWLVFTGNANSKGFEITASVRDRPIKGDIKFSKIEFFVKFKVPKLSVGLNVEIEVPQKGEIYKDNILQPQGKLTFGGTIELDNTAAVDMSLSMKGMWTKAFGISFLSIGNLIIGTKISIATGIPTKLDLSGKVKLGKNCVFDEDFKEAGLCIEGNINLGLTPDPLNQYFYGGLSSVTIGKIFRMLGSKLELPKIIADTGFKTGIVISFAWKEQSIDFNGKATPIKKGLYIKGSVDLLGLDVDLTLELNSDVIFVQTGLKPIKLPGEIQFIRSLKDKNNGPLFYAKATRNPLTVEIFLQGAAKIFGVETEIKFYLKPSSIVATLALKLPIGNLGAELTIIAGYGDKPEIESAGFTAKIKITTEKTLIKKDTASDVASAVNKARAKIQAAKDRLKDEKEKCKKRMATHCQMCQDIVCKEVTDSCMQALNQFKNYIGGVVNQFGGWFVGVSKKIASKFQTSTDRKRRSIPYFPYKSKVKAEVRRKRFVGRFLCQILMPELCQGSKMFCEGSCVISNHISKGVCKGLDLAHKSLYVIEDSFYWVKKAFDIIPKDMFILHGLSFELQLAASLKSKVAASIDVTVLKVRRQFTLEVSLEDIKAMAKAIVDKALQEFKKMFAPRFSKPVYDKPGDAADYLTSAPFRIQNAASKLCMQSPGSDADTAIGVAACAGDATLWVYTLTGELMSMQAGLCITVTGSGKELKIVQQQCQIASNIQKFDCEWDRMFLPGKDHCLIEKANTVGVEECKREKSDEEIGTKETPKSQEWQVQGDPRKKVCDNFVVDLALNKPTTQSSKFTQKDLEAGLTIKPSEKGAILNNVGPESAVNGDMSSSLQDGSCSHTSFEKDPWWKVDLQAEYIITDVSIQTANEGIKVDALSNFEIRVGMATEFKVNPMCGPRIAATHLGELWTSMCNPPIPGQYVSVQMFGMVYLTLCEVAVFARKDNQGKCSDELRRRRTQVARISYKDLVLKRAQITYGRYE